MLAKTTIINDEFMGGISRMVNHKPQDEGGGGGNMSNAALFFPKSPQRRNNSHRKVLSTILTILVLSLAAIWRMDSILELSGMKNFLKQESDETYAMRAIAKPLANTNDNLWIYVESWHEGIAGWRPSLSQILLLAKTFNATLVEPTISRSRLQRCPSKEEKDAKAPLRLSDILNRTLITGYHPKFATCHEYGKALDKNKTNIIYFDVCWDKNEECKNGVRTDHSSDFSFTMANALEAASTVTPEAMVVLRFHDMWQNSMSNLKMSTKIQPDVLTAAKQVATQHLHFRDSLYDTLDTQLKKHKNISLHGYNGDEFSVIHWRAEQIRSTSYLECAKGILQARKSMLQATRKGGHANTPQPNHPFFVMSSLSADDKNSWNGARKNAMNTTAPQALSLLRDERFYKLDTLFDDNTQNLDSIYYVAMDLILASKATMFATCTKRCNWPKYHYCKKCNWVGNFAHLALELRGDDATNSLPCWPQSARQVEPISRIPKEHV